MTMMRLAYASEAAFEAEQVGKGMEPTVAQILAISRRNNARNQLTGGLYYGGDRFFQYLEGEEDELRETYQRILEDDRHQHIVTLIDEPIEERTISNWSMKYVPLSADIRRFLDEEGLESFDPTLFSARQCEAMIELIRTASGTEHGIDPEEAEEVSESGATSVGLKLGLVISGLCLLAALVYTGLIL